MQQEKTNKQLFRLFSFAFLAHIDVDVLDFYFIDNLLFIKRSDHVKILTPIQWAFFFF